MKSELIVSRKMMRPSSLICGAARDMALEIRQPAVAGVAPVKAIWRDSAEYYSSLPCVSITAWRIMTRTIPASALTAGVWQIQD